MKQEIETLISKQLSHNSSIEEDIKIDKWRAQDQCNEDLYQQYRESWNIIQSTENFFMPDKEQVWNKILSQIQRPIRQSYSRKILWRVASIAASIALLIGISISFIVNTDHHINQQNFITVKAPKGQKSEIILPDGTSVWLNSESSLTYDNLYNIDNRSVKLEGEAFFDVAHNQNSKFIVTASGVNVEVYGTAFDVNAYPDSDSIDVSLIRGHVKVFSIHNNKLLADLIPETKAMIARNDLSTIISASDDNIDGIWRYGKLKITNEPIESVVNKMSRWYGVDIRINGKTTGSHYWLTIKTESLTEMLSLINIITPIDYSINGEEVIIRFK